jgi:two-component system cell cycle sensor histidine kinase/response regulator CckA
VTASQDVAVATALRRGADASADARAVFEAVRDDREALVDLRILYANAAYWALTGGDPEIELGRTLTALLPGIDRTEGLGAGLFQAMDSGQAYAEPRVRFKPDSGPHAGVERIFEVEVAAAADVMSARLRDITDAVEAEDDLASSRARFEAVFELAPIAMITVDNDQTIRYNQRAIELYGRGREEMIRLAFEPDAPWIPPDQVEHWADVHQRLEAGERLDGLRSAIVRPDGERREVEAASIQIITQEGLREGVVTVLTDLTDRLSLEAQFRHSQKMEALGRLAGGIAHDFNNVLMAIVGYAEFVARDARAGRPANVAHADEVVASTRRAIELTARLTTFARQEVARVESVDVSQLVRDILPLLKGLVPESVEIVTRLDPVPSVTLDRSEFEQTLVNLVVNGIDAMPDGGRLTIEVGAPELDAPNPMRRQDDLGRHVSIPHVSIAVSDTGMGMDEATRSRIFEPFFTTKGVGKGTGLGLSMAFAAVERADGTIRVRSEPGHGTTFRIHLPVADADAAIAADDPARLTAGRGGSESILLLEDDPLVRELLVTILRAGGYAVSVAALPSEALELAVGRRFDLLVSDVVMPEMTGNVVAARLRLMQPDLRVILMSGYTAKAVAADLGPLDSFVHKPLMPSEVAALVREALDRVVPA